MLLRARIALALLALAAGLGLVPRAANAFVKFDFDQRYFVQPGYIVKDHTLVQAKDGSYHLFYIKADETIPESDRAKTLGHATSTDLVHWTFQPDVIPVVPNSWEESFVWAPHIVHSGAFYYMFYTGVNRNFAQAIGLAVSPDLFNWVKYPSNPVYTPSTTWASWNSATWSNCRDPYVFQDGSTWYLTTTAFTLASKGALSLASSPDLVHWTDQGPLLVHPGPQAWHVLESSNVHKANGKYNLFFTEQNIGGSSYLSAPSLTGPWNYAARQPFDAGHATEVFQIGGQWMLSRHTTFTFAGVPRYVIKFDDLDWNTTGKPIVQWKDPLANWTVWSGDAFYLQPTFWDNSAARGSEPSNFGGNSWIGTSELFTGPLQVGYPGLSAGDVPVGIIRSAPFTLTGNRMSLLVGGGNDPAHLYVALYTAADTQLRLRASGLDSDEMHEVVWDTSAWRGQSAFLEIVDQASGTWGHINVDEITEYEQTPVGVGPIPQASLVLHQNTPNPFNPTTKIGFDLPTAGRARVAIYDVGGRVVRALLDAQLPAGPHDVTWDGTRADGSRAASGLYYYRLRFEDRPDQVRSMVLLK